MPKTGATKYQKFLKSEKSKTKLKSKKDLPKGTNVTKTNFKVKKIIINEQLKKHDTSEALSARKLNIKELLSRLKHFNTKSRTDALNGLKELLTSHPGVLEQNLGQLIHGVTPLVLNVEKVVRIETFKILSLILSNIEIEKIDPFFDIMCTYLRSAMTHIDSRIQEDSLLFLDTLLLCAPAKVAQDFHKIIPNFLDMISKLRADSKPGRTLIVNLGTSITSVKWRVKVLHRLQDYLQKFIKYNNVNSVHKPVENTTHVFNNKKLNNFSLFNPQYIAICHLNSFSPKKSHDGSFDEVEKFQQYTDTLMPLLFETWLEVCPNINSEKNTETVVNEDASSLLRHTLEVMSLLCGLVQDLNRKNPSSDVLNTFRQKFRKSYTQHFVKCFPYIANARAKQKPTTNYTFENVVNDPKLTNQNLEICHLYILLNPYVNVKSQHQEIVLVLNYIEVTFNQNTQDIYNEKIINILHTIFSNEVNSWTKSLSTMETLLHKVILAYFNKDVSNSLKQKIFNLLCKIALNDKLSHFHESDAFKSWLVNLPEILLESSITSRTVDIIHKFATRNNNVFNSIVQNKLMQIIENLPKILISDSNGDMCYHKLFSILFWIRSWDNESLNLLEYQLLENVYKNDHGNYIFNTIKLRI